MESGLTSLAHIPALCQSAKTVEAVGLASQLSLLAIRIHRSTLQPQEGRNRDQDVIVRDHTKE